MSALENYCGSPFWNTSLTWNTTDPDFTPCFQKTVLLWTPCIFLCLLSPLELVFIRKFPKRALDRNIQNIAQTFFMLVIILTQVIEYFHILYEHYEEKEIASVDFYSPIIAFITFVLCFILMLLQHRKGRHTSGILFIFWVLLNISNVIRFRSFMKKIDQSSQFATSVIFINYIPYFTSCLFQFLLSCFADVSPVLEQVFNEQKRSPEETASFLSRLTFVWFDRLAWLGYKRPITADDLWTLKAEYKTINVNAIFEKAWDQEIQKARIAEPESIRTTGYQNLQDDDSKAAYKKSMLNALWKTFGVPFSISVLFNFVSSLFDLLSPLILQLLIAFVTSNEPVWHGILYIAVLVMIDAIGSQLTTQFWNLNTITSIRMRSALISAVYKKSLKISQTSKQTSTVGEIVNLMSVDTERMGEMLIHLPLLFTCPIQIGVAVYMMYNILGVSALIGLSVIIIVAPINLLLGMKIEKWQMKGMEYKDERIKVTNEVLNGMRVLKLYAWEPPFRDKIQDIRQKELDISKKLIWLRAVMWFLFTCSPFLICLTMYTSYIFIDKTHVLDASTVFVSLAILHIIQEPLGFIPIIIGAIIQMRVSLMRLNKFMNLSEIDEEQINHEISSDAVQVENGTFSWQLDAEPTLSDISIKIPRGSLVAIVGSVGSGKSSFISSLLGEMEKLQGSVNTYGSIAYVPQTAWIQNASLKDNILFGKTENEAEYQAVINACALKPDLDILPAGDMTEIGEKGINLSGGQKQRVSLGRAVYNDADIYLLDDPLSAVDSHVGKHIFDELIGPNGLLKKKTRILVTHGVMHLPQADFIVVLEKGKIHEIGTYQELLDAQGTFYNLINIGQGDDKNDETDEEEETEIGNLPEVAQEARRYSRQSSGKSLKRLVSKDGSINDGDSPEKLQEKKANQLNSANLITEETVETGTIGWPVYFHYIKSIGITLSVITVILDACSWGLACGNNFWLSEWTNDPQSSKPERRNMYLGVYGGLNGVQSIVMFMAYLVSMLAFISASKTLHADMLQRVLRAPMSFFDVTPIGRIINRFSHDIDTVDTTIPMTAIMLMDLVLQLLGSFIIIAISTPLIIPVLVPISIIYFFVQKFYISTSRQLKRLGSNFRSPIYSHFSETLNGLAVIRAFKTQDAFLDASNFKIDHNHKAEFAANSATRWLSVRLDLLGAVIIFSTSMLAVFGKESIEPGTLGLALTYAITVTASLDWITMMKSELETYIVSVERIKEYSEIPSEAPWTLDTENVNSKWPLEGTVRFDRYSTRYREGLDLVLKRISFKIKDGEKIGVVGRTGAGKSSMALALFRLIEGAGGSINIDSINIANLGLHTLRSRLTIIPQDPVLFCGTLRSNLDPFSHYEDQDLWFSLEHSHLKDYVSGLTGGLEYEIAEGGENLSVGQRQLLCLARALLRKSKVLVLDEATAAVDLETDELIQATIRKEFADCTIFTIAHRLNTIMDSTRVLVLQNGTIEELDAPDKLLKNTNSVFYSMAKNAGLVD